MDVALAPSCCEDNRYDRLTHDFEALIGRPATRIREYVAKHRELFGSSRRPQVFP